MNQYGEDSTAVEDEIREFAGVDFYKSMFFDRGLSYALVRYLEEVQHVPRDEIETLDSRMLSSFADTYDMSFEYYKRAWKYYNEHATSAYTQENFEEFVESLDKSVSIELAFEAVIPGDFGQDIESYMCAPDSGIDEDEVVSFE